MNLTFEELKERVAFLENQLAQKQVMESKLLEIERQFIRIIYEAGVPIILVDPEDASILHLSPQAMKLTGYSEDELVGENLAEIFPEDLWEFVEKFFNSTLGEGRAELKDVRIEKKDGSSVPIELTGYLGSLEGKEIIYLSLREVGRRDLKGQISEKTSSFLHDLTKTLPMLLDFDGMLDRLVERLAIELPFNAFVLCLVENKELSYVVFFTSPNAPDSFVTEINERVMGLLVDIGANIIPTQLNFSLREKDGIIPCSSGSILSQMVMPIAITGEGIKAVAGLFSEKENAFSSEDYSLFSTMASGIASSYITFRSYQKIQDLSITDPLTGLFNRRKLHQELEREIKVARRYHHDLSLMMLDIDRFKALNDTFGHKTGDEILKGLSNLMRRMLREADTISRYGGEEFIVLLPNTGTEEAIGVSERLRKAVEENSIQWIDENQTITVSIGVTTYKNDEDMDSLIKRADEALYLAKSKGRNRVECIP
jgi:diguanylate cyclase (GGDEF)-like protein/PAS domain S-box-containing protein